MLKTLLLVAIIAALTSGVAAADGKKRDWQEGKLVDIKTEAARYTTQISYVIDGGDRYIYTATHQRRTNQEALPLTVNAKIKYAIEKRKMFILDEEGKEHELNIEKKALKERS